MTNSQRQSFKLHLPGLLKVLAEHLYTEKQVAVRELIQNAHDSCVRRRIETQEAQYRPRIHIRTDLERRVLIIEDNGCGLTADEIDTYLTTIGRSYTRDLRDRLALLSYEEASRLIGQFGFGFLSAFLVASEVILTTRSVRPGSQALCWRSSGDEYYDLTPANREHPGTTIELVIKPGAAFVLQHQQLVDIVQRYADFLSDPISVDDDPVPVNLMTAPWESSRPDEAMAAYIERAFHLSEPLAIMQLHDQEVQLEDDSIALPLRGFLFIPPSSAVSVREYGDLRIFIRGMFICDEERRLLPPWARFVRGVIDCPILQPTASREGVHQDETFAAIQRAIEDQLGAALRRIANEQPDVWRAIVRGHADIITGWAAHDLQFFDQVAHVVPFQTSRGQMTLPEYTALTGGVLYYTSVHLGSIQDKILAEGRDTPVIDAAWMGVYPFLKQYAQRHPGLRMEQLDGDVRKLLRPVDDDRFAALLAVCRKLGIRAQMAAFRPTDMPAAMVYPPNVDALLEARKAIQQNELPSPFAALVGGFLEQHNADEQDLQGVLYLNAGNDLVAQLADAPAGTALEPAVSLIYQIAKLFAGRALAPIEVAQAFKGTTTAIRELLRWA